MEKPHVKIDFECDVIDEVIEKVNQLAALLREAQ